MITIDQIKTELRAMIALAEDAARDLQERRNIEKEIEILKKNLYEQQ